ncbi:hypothetical protein Tco_1236848 [Tanacetum coccineum]
MTYSITSGSSVYTKIDLKVRFLTNAPAVFMDLMNRTDIMFVVCACARYQVDPKVSHLHAVKRIFRYLKGQPKLGLWYQKDSHFDLVAYTNSDYARASLDRKSTTGGTLVWPTFTVDGVTRPKDYTELTPAETIQADCDIKAINIILQGLPTEIYALVSQHRVAKDIWEKIRLLMQGTSLTKQEREFNTKFLNTLPAEWSKFVTDVKLVKDLHTTNVDQIHAHLEQHERHANEVRLMHERSSDPLALVV